MGKGEHRREQAMYCVSVLVLRLLFLTFLGKEVYISHSLRPRYITGCSQPFYKCMGGSFRMRTSKQTPDVK